MPRKAKTNGRPTDFGPLPVQVATGQPYGQAKKLADAQRAVPLAGPAGAGPGPGGVEAAATGFDPFQGVTPISAPTQSPMEPVTSGAPVGPGPGPDAMRFTQARQAQSVADTLTRIAQAKGDPELENYAAQARAQGV